MVGRGLHPMMPFKFFLHPLQEKHDFMSCGSKPTFFHRLPFNIFVNELTIVLFGWWHSHIGWCHYYWFHLSKLGITCGFCSWGGCDSGGSAEGRTLSQLLPNGCFFPLAIKVFGCLHKQSEIFFHRCAKRHWRPSFINFVFLV